MSLNPETQRNSESRSEARKRELGAWLKELRQGRGWSLEQTVRMAGNPCSRSCLCNIERGDQWPTVPVLMSLLETYDVPDTAVIMDLYHWGWRGQFPLKRRK